MKGSYSAQIARKTATEGRSDPGNERPIAKMQRARRLTVKCRSTGVRGVRTLCRLASMWSGAGRRRLAHVATGDAGILKGAVCQSHGDASCT
jgi:hypothetical protein